MKRITVLLVLVAFLLLAHSALAMSSANYRLDWFVPLTGGGGGEVASTNYLVNFTVGQTATGEAASAHYAAGLGYWYGAILQWPIHLPKVLRLAH